MVSISDRLDEARARQQSQPAQSVNLLRGILREQPTHCEALELLAKIFFRQQKHDVALDLLRKALQVEPQRASTHFLLGVVLKTVGELNEAIGHYQIALQLEPLSPVIHYNLGNALSVQNNLHEASQSYQRAVHLKPDFTDALYNLGNVLSKLRAPRAAVAAYRKALSLEPQRDNILVDLGQSLLDLDKQEEAMACFRQALQLNPRSVSALNNLGNSLRQQGRVDQAFECLRKAIELQPENAVVHNSLGVAFEARGDTDAAVECYRKALEKKPNYSIAHYNLANLELEFGNLASAEDGYQRAISINPEDAEAQYHLSCLWLLRGEYTPEAWAKFEWRWKMWVARGKEREFPQPAWDGSSLRGKTILLHAEMGLGDTLQFVRYARLVKKQAAMVLLECPRRLVEILSRCEGIDRILGRGDEELPAFDVHAPLMSLPGLLNTTFDTIPAPSPYLHADAAHIEHWKQRLGQEPAFRVGIAWQGKPTYLRDKSRSIPLEHFSHLSTVPDVQLVSLQQGHGSEQLASLEGSFPVQDPGVNVDRETGAFVETAAIMRNLDLVITSDTSIAHLAGGLGAPVWVALSYVPEWRWCLDRSDTPWYPTMRLFRQPAPGDWNSTFAAIKTALLELVLAGKETP